MTHPAAIQPFREAVDGRRERLTALASSGRRMIGYFCTYTPIEMVHAAGFLPVRILGGAVPIERAGTLTPNFICPYMRQALEKAMRGEYAYLTGVVQGYTCDVACGLLNIWELNIPGRIYHSVPLPYFDTPPARAFLRAALEELKEKLSEAGGRVTEDSLAASLDLYGRIREATLEVYELRAAGRLALSAPEMLTVAIAGLVTPPEDYLEMLRALAASAAEAGAGTDAGSEPAGVPVFVTGSVIDEPRVLEILESCGGRVAGDDLCTGRRGHLPPYGEGDDPVERLMDRHFRRFPCPSRRKAQERAPLLAELARDAGARGVVFFLQKFCTPYLADLPEALAALKAEGIRALVVEMEEAGFNEGQLRTRLETFLEMVGG